MPSLSGKRLVLLGVIIVLLFAIPLTIYLAQKQQETRSRASASTRLFFAPSSSQTSPIQKNVDDTFTLDIMMDPGTNQVIQANLIIDYDATKLATDGAGLAALPVTAGQAGLPVIFSGPTYSDGNAEISLSIGADKQNAVQATTKIATITFKTLAATDTPVQISFSRDTLIKGLNSTDLANENVLSSAEPAWIAVAGTSVSPTPTLTITPTPTQTPSITPTPTSVAQNQAPVCTALNMDRAATGSAPLAITFTANGNDTDGTVNKVTFDFGDGPAQDVTQAGGIGTKNVSVQLSHTYQNGGAFTASAVLTDNNGGTSTPSTCTQAITVAGPTVTPGGGIVPTDTPIPTATPTTVVVEPTIQPPGPGGTILGVGLAGAILTIIGGLILLAL